MIATGQRFPETANSVWVQTQWFYPNLFYTTQIDFYIEDSLLQLIATMDLLNVGRNLTDLQRKKTELSLNREKTK